MSTEQGVSDDAASPSPTSRPSTSTPKGLRVLDDNGAWCWFQDERTLADPATGTVVVGSVASAGGQGVITPDLIPDEAEAWTAAAQANGLSQIYLVAPSSTPERLQMTVDAASGFVYAQAVMGVTGAREAVSDLPKALTRRIRAACDLPVCVGLGVRDGAQAAEIASYADGVIVGSAFVRTLLEAGTDRRAGLAALRALTEDLAGGVRRA